MSWSYCAVVEGVGSEVICAREGGGGGGIRQTSARVGDTNIFSLECAQTELVRCTFVPTFTMPSLLIIVLFLQLAIHLINTVGAQAINDLVSPRFLTLPKRDN